MYQGGMARTSVATELAPPEFLRLAGHPLRWRLLSELSRSDRVVHELTGLVGQPQNLVSYHLGKLRDGRLVRPGAARPTGATRTTPSTWLGCGALLARRGAALHPGLGSGPPRPAAGRRAGRGRPPGAVPVHGQQRPLADGRGAGPGAVRRHGRDVQRRQAAQGDAPRRRAGHARARRRPLWPPAQAPGRVRRRAFRPGGHPVRPGARGLPRVPGRPRADPLEHPRPRRHGDGDVAGYAAFRRAADELEGRVGFLLAALPPPPPRPPATSEEDTP